MKKTGQTTLQGTIDNETVYEKNGCKLLYAYYIRNNRHRNPENIAFGMEIIHFL